MASNEQVQCAGCAFERAGSDLVLAFHDGARISLPDFFDMGESRILSPSLAGLMSATESGQSACDSVEHLAVRRQTHDVCPQEYIV